MSIHYEFPIIRTIDDVLPHIDDNFRITTQNDITYINYNHMSPDTFPTIRDENDIRNKIRRECRGIAFDKDGKIISRPFHKFFNVGERDDTLFDEYHSYIVEEKLDGSMIRPIPTDKGFRLATKAGVTEVAMKAELALTKGITDDIMDSFNLGLTPIYEYTGPDNRIVLDYPEPKLTLLAYRHNVTGNYVDGDAFVLSVDSMENIHVKNEEDIEGVIISYTNGHRLKLKSDWYVKLHRLKDLVSNERKLVRLILEDGLDDVLPVLSEEGKRQIRNIESRLWAEVKNNAWLIDTAYGFIRESYPTKKEYAIATSSNPTPLRPLIFKLWDKKVDNSEEAVVQYLLSSMGNKDKYYEMKETLKLSEYTQ